MWRKYDDEQEGRKWLSDPAVVFVLSLLVTALIGIGLYKLVS